VEEKDRRAEKVPEPIRGCSRAIRALRCPAAGRRRFAAVVRASRFWRLKTSRASVSRPPRDKAKVQASSTSIPISRLSRRAASLRPWSAPPSYQRPPTGRPPAKRSCMLDGRQIAVTVTSTRHHHQTLRRGGGDWVTTSRVGISDDITQRDTRGGNMAERPRSTLDLLSQVALADSQARRAKDGRGGKEARVGQHVVVTDRHGRLRSTYIGQDPVRADRRWAASSRTANSKSTAGSLATIACSCPPTRWTCQ